MFRYLIILAFLIAAISAIYFFKIQPAHKQESKSPVSADQIYAGVSYEAVDSGKYEVTLLAQDLVNPTRLKITPDGRYLVVTQLTGEVMAFNREGKTWNSTPYLVTQVDTHFPGFPPEEAGLVSIIFSKTNKAEAFLLYSYKDKDGKIVNRIASTQLSEKNGKLRGTQPKIIFEANVAGSHSHQITDGFTTTISKDGTSEEYIVFAVGEGFDGKKAQDPDLDAGKFLAISRDGKKKKLIALGIRNAYVFGQSYDAKLQFLADTGPDHWDRLINVGPFLNFDSPTNLGWNGEEEKLKTAGDPYVVFRLPDTRTITGLAFGGKESNILYATAFGKTGSTQNSPGKEIWQGTISRINDKLKVEFQPIVKRKTDADGKLGNPIGLELDWQNEQLLFADVFEGRIYLVKGGDISD